MFNKSVFKKKCVCISVVVGLLLSQATLTGFAKGKAPSVNEPEFATDSVILIMSDGKEVTIEEAKTKYADVGIDGVTSLDAKSESPNSKNKHLKIELKNKSKKGVLKALEKLNSKPEVLVAEPNSFMTKCSTTPNDEYFKNQSNMKLIAADQAWDLTTGSPNIIVGIIDSGVHIDNKDISPNIWRNPGEIFNNNIDDDGNGYVDDYFGYNFAGDNADCFDDDGHGTMCAGLVGAKGNNGSQIAGVCWNTKIASLRIEDAQHRTVSAADMAEAINYATKMGIQILNISMGSNIYSQAIYDAIKSYPGLVVAAAGNYSRNNDTLGFYPASYDLDNIISVGNTDHSDKLAPDSNYGKVSVDLTAPGFNNVWTTGPTIGTAEPFWGTSASTPQVAGAAALLMAYRPTYTVANVKQAILSNVDYVSGLSGVVATSGRLNVYKALTNPLPDTTPPSASNLTVFNYSSQAYYMTVNHQGEYWTNYSTVRARLSSVMDTGGVQGVKFYVVNYSYPNSYSMNVVNGKRDGYTNNWYADIPVSGNNMTIQAFPVDKYGNTLFDSMKGNYSYKHTKSFWIDNSTPDGYTYIEPQGNYWISSNRYVTNASQIKLRVHAHDFDGAQWNSSSISSIKLSVYKNGSTTSTDYPTTYVSGNAERYGDYEYTFNVPSAVGENSYKVVAVITDYAGNVFNATPQYFVTDNQSPRGNVSTASTTVYGDSFDVYINNVTEASYVTKVWFPTWTDANGQDDIIWYEGSRIGDTTWKITINRSYHKNEKGLYYTHVYTEDYFGNTGMTGATAVNLR